MVFANNMKELLEEFNSLLDDNIALKKKNQALRDRNALLNKQIQGKAL